VRQKRKRLSNGIYDIYQHKPESASLKIPYFHRCRFRWIPVFRQTRQLRQQLTVLHTFVLCIKTTRKASFKRDCLLIKDGPHANVRISYVRIRIIRQFIRRRNMAKVTTRAPLFCSCYLDHNLMTLNWYIRTCPTYSEDVACNSCRI